jgi:CheY-specific phosphatase CheX
MPSLEAVKEFRTEMFKSSMSLIDKKGADYNREQQLAGDTLFNLKVAEILGIVSTTERGILVRLSDKFMRLISLMNPGVEAAVKDESVRDTVRDIHNYVDYALMIWEERRRDQPKQAVEARTTLSARSAYPAYGSGIAKE